MFKNWVKWLSSLALVFSLVGLGLVDNASAKGYRSGKGYFQPSHSQQIAPKKSPNTSIFNTQKPNTTPTHPNVAPHTSKGSFAKGLLLGGLGGFLAGSLFGGLGPISSMLGFVINLLLLFVIIMLVVNAIRFFRNQRADDSWRR
mgnify:CR=1 FL=1|jgi:predicted lipid-binding transport protein (Tim44 family)